jgi:hypothetical protein
MRLPQMTTRRWMIVAAVVGPLAGMHLKQWRGDLLLKQRQDYFLSRMQIHLKGVKACDMVYADGSCQTLWSDARREKWKREVSLTPRRHAYHVAMYQKYERASRQPWLPVEPDPPAPK